MPLHKSIAIPKMELVNIEPTSYSPLIEKCQIKVCYVGDEPNRNGSVITKEVAEKMAPSLRGAAIVGYYNEQFEDFEEHNCDITFENGELKFKDTTKPYGFVDLNAKVWFQEFDDVLESGETIRHEYLMTEGFLWTSQYPEAKRIIEKGNNQSMELDEEHLKAHWSQDDKGNLEFFIINEAVISKLCILGEGFEPCFEGSQITKTQFSFESDFKKQLFSMMNEFNQILSKGGAQVSEQETVLEPQVKEVSEPEVKEEIPAAEEVSEIIEPAEEPASETEFKKKDDEDEKKEDESEDDSSEGEEDSTEKEEDDEEKKKKKDYSLEEIPEYVELTTKFSDLEAQYAALKAEKESLEEQMKPLVEFKKTAEKKEKEKLIQEFYMLSDEDKADVITNIDTYSLSDIEAKLSIICFRKKVTFEPEEKETENPTIYNLQDVETRDSAVPAWVQAVLDVEKEM